MTSKWMFMGALTVPALTFLTAGPAAAQEQRTPVEPSTGALVQVAPKAQKEAAKPKATRESSPNSVWFQFGDNDFQVDVADEEPFAPDHWLFLLSDADLDTRMSNFDKIVELASRNQEAYAWLEARAADTVDPELSWTSKLALRDVQRNGGQLFFGNPGAGRIRVHNPGAQGGNVFQFGPGGLDREVLRFFGNSGGADSQGRSVSVNSSPDGVTVTIVEVVDGKQTSTDYEAADMDALLEAHPELKDLIGGGQGFRMRLSPDRYLDLDGLQLELDGAFGESMPRHIFRLKDSAQNQPFGSAPNTLHENGMRTDVLGVYMLQATRAQLEARGLDPDLGLYVDSIAAGTLAAKLGIASGDVLQSINGVKLLTVDSIGDVMRSRKRGEDLVVQGLDSTGKSWTRTWNAPVANETKR